MIMPINARILLSVASIAAAGALVAGSTFAFFSDNASSNDNVFQSGTLTLEVKDDNQGFTQDVTASFATPVNWAPGETHTNFICFKNTGSIDIQDIILTLSSNNALLTSLDDFVYVSNIELGPVADSACTTVGAVGSEGLTNFLTLFNSRFDTNVNGKATLTEQLVEIDGTDLSEDDLLDGPVNLLPVGATLKFRVEWTFDTAATSSVAGQTVDLDILFRGTQTEDQI